MCDILSQYICGNCHRNKEPIQKTVLYLFLPPLSPVSFYFFLFTTACLQKTYILFCSFMTYIVQADEPGKPLIFKLCEGQWLGECVQFRAKILANRLNAVLSNTSNKLIFLYVHLIQKSISYPFPIQKGEELVLYISSLKFLQ